MASVTSNSTSNTSYAKTTYDFSLSKCIPWFIGLSTECLAIVILNIITIIVFVKQRQLQRRSTYLIIHLAIADLLVGAVSGPLHIAVKTKTCVRRELIFGKWTTYISGPLITLFPFISLMNLVVISLERMHATFRPFSHRLLKTWHYGIAIVVMWAIAGAMEVVPLMLNGSSEWNLRSLSIYHHIHTAINVIFLLVICISYVSIYVKVRYRPRIYHHGAAQREQKFTTTLLIVTIVSLLTWLPALIFSFINWHRYFGNYVPEHLVETSTLSEFAMVVLATANSLVNPILYAVRMEEFRTVLRQLFRRPNRRVLQDIRLNPRIR